VHEGEVVGADRGSTGGVLGFVLAAKHCRNGGFHVAHGRVYSHLHAKHSPVDCIDRHDPCVSHRQRTSSVPLFSVHSDRVWRRANMLLGTTQDRLLLSSDREQPATPVLPPIFCPALWTPPLCTRRWRMGNTMSGNRVAAWRGRTLAPETRGDVGDCCSDSTLCRAQYCPHLVPRRFRRHAHALDTRLSHRQLGDGGWSRSW